MASDDFTSRKQFGAVVRSFRTDAGLSQEALATAASLDRTYISGIERGVRNPTLEIIVRLADALGRQPSELFPKPGPRSSR